MSRCGPAQRRAQPATRLPQSCTVDGYSCPLHLRIGIAYGCQIGGARAGVEFAEHIVIALLGFELGDAGVGVVGIAENDGLGGARRLARGNDFAVADGAILLFGFDARVVDALHAISALLHHAAAADSDFGVAHELELRRFPILEAQEIEAANLVGAVIGAIACADAAVVDHVVQAFRAVHRGAYRADLLARSVLALHARNRLEKCFRIRKRIVVVRARVVGAGLRVVVAVDANPVHFSSAQDLIFADYGSIVFRDASDYARIAAVATVQVNSHAPGVARVLELLIEGQVLGRSFVMLMGESGILLVFL